MRHRRGLLVAAAGIALGMVVVQAASTAGAGAQPAPAPLGHVMGSGSGSSAMAAPAGTWITAPVRDQVRGVTPSTAVPSQAPTHHEFQANCTVTHHRPDDPIVYPGQAGASHDHTFLGNPSVNARTTTASLRAATNTTCKVPEDKSAYWMPTMYDGDTPVLPVGPQVVYYKSGVFDYTSVRPFPTGLRYVVGSPSASMADFAQGSVEGFECGNSSRNYDFATMTDCPAGSRVNVRYQAPSCWDGVHLDSPDHKSHIVYPVAGRYGRKVCPASHPVAVPMLEFKMAFPVDGNVSRVRLASGRGYSFHYDFFNAWDPATLRALLTHCINGGLQCDARGFDLYKPGRGAALTEDYRLPR